MVTECASLLLEFPESAFDPLYELSHNGGYSKLIGTEHKPYGNGHKPAERGFTRNKEEQLAKQKSRELFKLLLYHAHSLRGEIYRYKDRRSQRVENADLLDRTYSQIMTASWLYGHDGELHKITELSKYDLSTEIYGEVTNDDEAYKILGFKITEQDTTASAFKQIEALERRDKMILLKQLARELGKSISDDATQEEPYEERNSTFDANAWMDNEFPVHRVKNFDSLIQHVKEQFFCADPIRYRDV